MQRLVKSTPNLAPQQAVVDILGPATPGSSHTHPLIDVVSPMVKIQQLAKPAQLDLSSAGNHESQREQFSFEKRKLRKNSTVVASHTHKVCRLMPTPEVTWQPQQHDAGQGDCPHNRAGNN